MTGGADGARRLRAVRAAGAARRAAEAAPDLVAGAARAAETLLAELVDDAGRPLLAGVRLRLSPGADLATAGHTTGTGVLVDQPLGDGPALTAELHPVRPGACADDVLRTAAAGIRAGLLAHAGDAAGHRDALRDQLDRAEAALAEHDAGASRPDLLDTLQSIGRRLTSQLDLDALVQDATDAAVVATGAAFGAFFYNLIDDYGESYTLYTLSGVPRSAFERFPMPRNTEVFAPTFAGAGTVRSDDITADPRYGHNAPHAGMPEGHLPVCSYLAVPVVSPSSGEVLGGFFFGHPERARFTARHEELAEGIAGYAAIALDNARLYGRQRAMATELQRSMLPVIGTVPGFQVVGRYLPAATGSEVGGDWIDVVELPAGRTAFVIGDVMGRGVPAATVMGQVRTAIRAYALLDLPPGQVLAHVSELAAALSGHQFITCVYAVHDPAEATITYANAGHLPPAVADPDGRVTVLDERLGMPLRVGAAFAEREVPFPPGASLLLYTDGLVERRRRALPDTVTDLAAAWRDVVSRPPEEAEAACDALIRGLTQGRYDDDVALLHVRDLAADRRTAAMALTADSDVAARARQFVRDNLQRWDAAAAVDRALMIVTELVANAVRHTGAPVRLRLHAGAHRLVIAVADADHRTPRRHDPDLLEEGHRGLLLVDAFAARWGSRPTPDGKVVWAEVPLHG
ncbi:ATP-binding SpoIIE family protein phosphatase [Spirilliplanes yamanashiensis]|uniref:protein-serine/threonine phosphatase n=1 Tax=Spirilliplanes yamanashiensis TaxID=42233 RepID=A0A8J3YCS5_9ACTN|nr:SpoIIE family protein phosphatase [Spirilliplanes yamanashiensis]MDP9818932.1 anti-sigma regulatory factor (Ser/Thr protein kinase) [Spirilliplanes yamanashiensis]GIJ05387.1 hypothetical protein Sya03_47390 [Spirilliplanes yamanashiensis]